MFDFLEVLQFDTSTVCNSRCHYCAYHSNPNISFIHYMPMPLVEKILSQTEDYKIWRIQPWLAGEPLLEPRMLDIIKLIRKYQPTAEIDLFTNATVYENRQVLMAADKVDITISAATPETYQVVTGTPLYHEAVKTVEWLEQQPNHPKIVLRIVVTDRNAHEVEAWKKQWSRFQIFENIAEQYLRAGWTPHLELDGEPEQMKRGEHTPNTPCLFWNLCCIDVFGDMYQCCKNADAVYGNVNETPLIDLWRKRVANNRNTPRCQNCPTRVR